MTVLETERLLLERLTSNDDAFIVELLNEPAFLKYIGDRGVRNQEDARNYISTGPASKFDTDGFGLCRVTLKESGDAIGICGLLRRETLDDVDIGYAFLRRHRQQGYAQEAAAGTLKWARESLGFQRVIAIVTPNNEPSIQVLRKIGMEYESMVRLVEDESELMLFATDWKVDEA